jgi:DNA-binding NtrC family response regulator
VVEDDRSGETVLRHIIHSVDPEAKVDWVENAEVAALTLVQESSAGRPYDLIISDVFLAGKLTGIDLFKIYHEFKAYPPMVLTSSMGVPRFLEAFGKYLLIPTFLPKPYYVEECREIIQRFLAGA